MTTTILSNIQTVTLSNEENWQSLLQTMADLAVEKQWAKEGFTKAILERESKYATGLHAAIDIAIPHADAEWTVDGAMIVAFLDQPVAFEPMGGIGGTVNAKLVFMLVIPDAKAHIDFLQAMAGFIEDEKCLNDLYQSKDISELISYLQENMGKTEEE